MKKKVLSLMLVGAMATAMLAGCGSSSSTGSDAAATDATGSAEAEAATTGDDAAAATGDNFTIAANRWGTGAYPLDIMTHADEIVAGIAGVTVDTADNQFTADKIITDLQSQLATSPDAVLMFSVVDTVFGQVQQLCDAQNVPYAIDCNFPSDESVLEAIESDELYIGGCSADQAKLGADMATAALEAGNKTAIILGAAIGDYSHDQRIEAFIETFEAGGGTVVQTMHCSDPSESTTKANDLMMANPDVDCAYASGGDYLSALAAIKAGDASCTMELYGTDVAPDLISYIQDGTIQAMDGGNQITGAVSLALTINYLDGHQILDADGNPATLLNLECYTITPDNADGFAKLYADESCFVPTEDWENLLYRCNPDVSYDTFNDFMTSYDDIVCDLAAQAE